ncbi:MAG: hypothetical protein JWO03_1358 [Bacteroidetes bacterium]|nr:hypothetical protein [Bacteroidota bacterium]
MKIFSFLLAGLVIFVAASAFALISKDRIKEVKNIKTGTSTIYTYTADGRVATGKNSNGVTSVYEYRDKVIYRKTEDPRTKTSAVDTFILNSKGLVKELRIGAHLSVTNTTQQFEYDPDGFQTEWRTLSTSRVENTIKTIFQDSNAVSLRQNFTGDSREGKGTSSYYSSRRNTISNENFGTAFLGLSSRNLIKEQIYFWTDRDTSRTYFNYHFDEKGRVSIKATYYQGKLGDSTAYSYY